MLGAILRATNSSFQKGMTFCRSIYVKTIMKLLAFIFEQPSYQWESDKLTEDTTNESQEVSPFPAGDQKAHINRRAQNIAKRSALSQQVTKKHI